MKHFIKYILLIVVAISFSTCAKETQQKMVGKWKLHHSTPQSYVEYWTFTETDVNRVFEYTDTTIIQNSGSYQVKTSKKFSISGSGSTTVGVEYFKGDWTIKSIDSQGMVIHRQTDGLIYNEFEKQ
jgi:hypothetical protein